MILSRKNTLLLLATFIVSILTYSCSEAPDTQVEDSALMGQFDSLLVAQTEGPTMDYYYENMVMHSSFYAKDSVEIGLDLYEASEDPIRILLLHQAGYSRGEYKYSGIILSQMGFNCAAVDLRSGNTVNNVKNLAFKSAIEKELPTSYSDASTDIVSAIDYLYECNGRLPLVLVGSSYSASLALLIAENNPKVKAVAAFSPGEYLENTVVKDELDSISIPIFVTSSKLEISQTQQIISNIDSSLVKHYKPEVEGVHGSSALWKTTEGYKDYWNSFLVFLYQLEIK